MTAMSENELFIRNAYQVAERQDVQGWAACFNIWSMNGKRN